jgi:riboflavin biosynthesis pyrimidine reductase
LTPLLHACALAVCSEAKHRQILGASQTLRQQHSSHQTPSPLFAERNRTIAENGSTIAVITDATSTTEKVSNILDDPAASPVRQQQQRDSAKLKSRPQQRYRQHQWQQYRAVKDEGIAARVCAELLLEAGANLGAVNAQVRNDITVTAAVICVAVAAAAIDSTTAL